MTKSNTKILLLLAASDLHDREIEEFSHWLASSRRSALVKAVRSIRETANRAASHPVVRSDSSLRASVTTNSLRKATKEEVALNVERLLREEAGLSASEVRERLVDALVQRGVVDPEKVPVSSRKALSYWIAQLVGYVPPYILLQEAIRLRNELVHDESEDDWPLRKRKQS